MRQPVIRPTRVFDPTPEKNRPIASLESQTREAVRHLGDQKLDPQSISATQRSGTYRAKPGETVRVEPPTAGVNVLLPPAAGKIKGRRVTVKKTVSGANIVRVRVADGGSIEGGTEYTSTTALITLIFECDGAAWWKVN